jgi:hypothetical protein
VRGRGARLLPQIAHSILLLLSKLEGAAECADVLRPSQRANDSGPAASLFATDFALNCHPFPINFPRFVG